MGTNRHHWRFGVHHLDRPAVAVLLNASAGRAYHITPAGDNRPEAIRRMVELGPRAKRK